MNLPTLLQQRSDLLRDLREFFTSRGFIEVDTPLVDIEIIPETHIEPLLVPDLGYLQASPEMHLKRLLAAGVGSLFEITKCFRAGERGAIHRPEFTMVEWYRTGDGMREGMGLLAELIEKLCHAPATRSTSYRQAFIDHVGIDPHNATVAKLQAAAGNGLDDDRRDELLNYLLATQIEPKLGQSGPELLYHFPASQSALATTTTDPLGTSVAERFELYWKGIELANGYHELTDASELRGRLETANRQRIALGHPPLPLPERLLAAMVDPGLPTCAGVALGFDRLLMLATGRKTLDEILPW